MFTSNPQNSTLKINNVQCSSTENQAVSQKSKSKNQIETLPQISAELPHSIGTFLGRISELLLMAEDDLFECTKRWALCQNRFNLSLSLEAIYYKLF